MRHRGLITNRLRQGIAGRGNKDIYLSAVDSAVDFLWWSGRWPDRLEDGREPPWHGADNRLSGCRTLHGANPVLDPCYRHG